jgi:hypothetical protein
MALGCGSKTIPGNTISMSVSASLWKTGNVRINQDSFDATSNSEISPEYCALCWTERPKHNLVIC